MRLKKITLKNIRSYKFQEIEFPEGSILLAGEVGSGKTTILLAIEYALFGVQPGQKGSSLLRNDSKIGEVSLELEVGGKQIIIDRKLKRVSKGVSNEYAAISINGEKIESSVTEIKSKMVEILGYPSEFVKKNNMLYRYTVYTPQEQMKQIILEDVETRMNILRHIFGIDKYKRMSENLAIVLNNLKNDVKYLQGEIKTLDEDKSLLESKKLHTQEISQKIESIKTQLKFCIAKREAQEAEISALDAKLQEKRKFEQEVEKTKIMMASRRETLSSINREIEEIQKNILETEEIFDSEEYKRIIDELTSKKEIIENLSFQIMDLTAKIGALEKEKRDNISKKERIFSIRVCPTCLQDVSEFHKHNILNETEGKIALILSQLPNLEKERSSLQEKVQSEKKEIIKLEERKVQLEILKAKREYLEKSKLKLQEMIKQRQIIEKDFDLLSKHIENLKENILRYSSFENLIRKKQLELRQYLTEEKKVEIALAEFRKEQQLTEIEIRNLELSILKKENLKKSLQNLNEIIDWLSSQFAALIEFTERNVLLRLRNEFSKLFRQWFLMLVPENGLNCHLDENFTPIISQGETEMDYEFLSGGERTAVALAYRLALNQTVNSLLSKIRTRGIVILDEPTDGFSDAQINKMNEIFEELNATQLIIVSHEPKIESFVDNVLNVSKEGDVSRVTLTKNKF